MRKRITSGQSPRGEVYNMIHEAGEKLEWEDDVGVPSVGCEYVLLPLVNKEAALAYGRIEYR